MARQIDIPDDIQPPQKYVWANIIRDARLSEGGRSILDIGPGRTLFPGIIASRGNQVTAVDRLQSVLQWQAHIIRGNKVYYNLHMTDGEILPFNDRHFDLVTACWSIANIENGEQSPEVAYDEARRVTNHMLFTVVNFSSEGGVRQSQYSGKEKIFSVNDVQRFLDRSRKQGFEVDRVSFLRDDGQQVNHHIAESANKSFKKGQGGPADHVFIALRRM